MREFDWYIVQVQHGAEDRMCAAIIRACNEASFDANGEPSEPFTLQECFCPRFRTQKKIRGEWIDLERPLMPGYVVAVTNDLWRLQRVLNAMLHFARVVTSTGTYIPLGTENRQWIEQGTREGDRVVPMSMAYKEGDRVVVTSGPLVGKEGDIVRVNRKASLAFLEFHVGALRITATVGLGIVSKTQEPTTE